MNGPRSLHRGLSHLGEVYGVMFRNSLIREMNFKLNFLLWMLVEVLWFMGQIVFIEVVFSYVGAIGGWSKWEVVLLIGTHQLIGQVFQAFFYRHPVPALRCGRLLRNADPLLRHARLFHRQLLDGPLAGTHLRVL
ncbi:MAG: ABC-2 family transporter protein [Verrucomicrobia bacterium]|nr:ABC-2 family transporter protein [Verrucomicrobiota bacterium]